MRKAESFANDAKGTQQKNIESGVAMMQKLKWIWQRWKVIAHKIGDFQARLLLSLFYFIVFAPFALVVRMFSDPLQLRPGAAKGWMKRPGGESDPSAQARRQF